MKPTVIASGGGENPSSHHPAGNSVNSAANMGPNGEGGSGAPNTSQNSRQFPQFQTGFGFDPDDDLFSDAALRSRLNRFRDPFSFARKRCGNSEHPDDPYSRYFDDDSDFFPNFGSLSGRRRTPSQNASTTKASPFFEHIPAQFRHYIPDDFGFPNVRTTSAPQPQYQQQAHPQQYYETYVQPPSPTAQPPQQKPKLCDAAIQTEDLSETDGSREAKNLKQYGMRNTVDLGQKSPPEECRGPRSHSAPPPDNGEQNPQGQCTPNATQTYPLSTQNQAEDPQHTSQGTQPMTPPHPPPRQQAQQPQYTPWQQHQQQQQQQQAPQQPQATSPGGGFSRTVPIFVEGRSDPVISKNVIPPQQQQPPRPSQPQKQKPGHPSPLNTQQPTPVSGQPPPQTPQTAECISKIQAIQRDVLDLMSKVEHFQGMRGDKEYMYLDEMLTRNLLKLDTIDTNGKDSIRLARREAIKCIQASINVLEAKSEENAKTAQSPQESAVIEGPSEEGKIAEVAKAEEGGSEVKENAQEEAASLPPENVAIPLPPPPTKAPPIEPSDESKKVEESTAEGTKPDEEIKAKEEDQGKTDQKTVESGEKEKPAKMEEATIPAQSDTKPMAEKSSEQKPEAASEPGAQKQPDSINESETAKPANTGAVKKKIVKKKKPVGEAVSPPEEKTAAPKGSQAEKDPSQPQNAS